MASGPGFLSGTGHGDHTLAADPVEGYGELKEIHERENTERDQDSARIRDSLTSFSTFETSLALVFSQTLTINDHTDVNFIALILQYVGILLIIKIVRGWVTQHEKQIVAGLGLIFYNIATQLIQFYLLLYTYIILREVQAYFNLTISDTPAIVAIFVFWSLSVHTVNHFAANKKFTVIVEFLEEKPPVRTQRPLYNHGHDYSHRHTEDL